MKHTAEWNAYLDALKVRAENADTAETREAAATAGKTSLTFTNSDFPLEAVSDVSMEAVVSGKTATVDFDGDSDTYTRQ